MTEPGRPDRFPNPWAQPPGCASCDDLRRISAADHSSIPCPVCGCSCPKRGKDEPPPEPCSGCRKSRDLRRAAFLRHNKPPSISKLDLTDAELATARQLKADHPRASPSTILGWIEGQRYNPSEDNDFLTECEAALNAWRRQTGRPEQPSGSLKASLGPKTDATGTNAALPQPRQSPTLQPNIPSIEGNPDPAPRRAAEGSVAETPQSGEVSISLHTRGADISTLLPSFGDTLDALDGADRPAAPEPEAPADEEPPW